MAARAPIYTREFYIESLNISLKSLCINDLITPIFFTIKIISTMKKNIQYALAMLLVLLMACQKDPDVSCNSPTNDLALSRKLIIGTWRLKRTVFESTTGIIRKTLDTAQIDVKFTTNGIVEYYEKGKFIDTCRYEIDTMKKYSLYRGDTARNVLWIPIRKLSMAKVLYDMVPLRVCNDSLFLLYQSFAYDAVSDRYFYKLK